MRDNITLGRLGENIAISFLKKNGYSILHRNWRCLFGEIDIVAQHEDFIVIVEIKTRRSSAYGPGYLAITRLKQLKLIRLTQAFLKRYGLTDHMCRIDIVSIAMDGNSRPVDIELIKDAFWEQ
ncbi:MAG: YraN family protein [Candidatus Omnitrophica bacterium]|nr:YraN family protein [Candidatus Omnitrophota bacterium]